MELTPELTTGLVAIASALVGAMPGIVSGFFTRKADDKKQLRELVMKTTAENWRFVAENTKAILPFEHYMLHTAMMCDLAFSGEEITEERTTAHLAKVDAVMRVLEQHAKSVSNIK
ncbi:MAG: hypothetical protein HOP36_02625 [Methyloglobulus sp.]|nr:hypothetical protein [Methyloglobulus sp.]